MYPIFSPLNGRFAGDMGHFPTWDCDVFCCGYIMYPIWIQILFIPIWLCIILDLSILGMLDKVLYKMDFGFLDTDWWPQTKKGMEFHVLV